MIIETCRTCGEEYPPKATHWVCPTCGIDDGVVRYGFFDFYDLVEVPVGNDK